MDDTPLFRELAAEHLARGGRHRWIAEPDTAPIEPEVPVGRHGDDDADSVANQADPDWSPDERDEHAHDDQGCDQAQDQPDRWVGVQRDPDALPITREAADA